MNKNRWVEWDSDAQAYTYEGTKNHVFAPGTPIERRIGDMERDELIHALATTLYDRECLSRALLTAVNGAMSSEDANQYDMGIVTEFELAQTIVNRYDGEGRIS